MECINKCGKEVREKRKRHCQECYDKLKKCIVCNKCLYDIKYTICMKCSYA